MGVKGVSTALILTLQGHNQFLNILPWVLVLTVSFNAWVRRSQQFFCTRSYAISLHLSFGEVRWCLQFPCARCCVIILGQINRFLQYPCISCYVISPWHRVLAITGVRILIMCLWAGHLDSGDPIEVLEPCHDALRGLWGCSCLLRSIHLLQHTWARLVCYLTMLYEDFFCLFSWCCTKRYFCLFSWCYIKRSFSLISWCFLKRSFSLVSWCFLKISFSLSPEIIIPCDFSSLETIFCRLFPALFQSICRITELMSICRYTLSDWLHCCRFACSLHCCRFAAWLSWNRIEYWLSWC